MTFFNKREQIILLLGDIFFFLLSLWVTLIIRYLSFPSSTTINDHLVPFTFLFLVWIVVFYISGLYEKHTVILKNKLPTIILNAQLVNSVLAIIFFYFIPYFGITPKTNLFIYLFVSFVFMVVWRIYGYDFIGRTSKENAILIGSGQEMKELFEEVNNNPRYDMNFISSVDLTKVTDVDFQEEILKRIYSEDVSIVAIDLSNEKVEPVLPHLYNLIFSKIKFIDMHKIYEDIFDKVPLSLLKYTWFLENISTSPKITYDFLKRMMDILLSLILGIVSLIFYPFIILAIKLDDKGPIFIIQERVGKNNKAIKIIKFRSMTKNDEGNYGNDGRSVLEVTKVGNFLRKTRLDEIPQLWNIFIGDISLIGPRPELPGLVKVYEKEISYYNVRHLIKPGLSGWAQIYQENHPHHMEAVMETKEKLSYDLFYIKNRSFFLDLKITLRTIKTLISRVGA